VDKKIIAIICLSAVIIILAGIIGYISRPADGGLSTTADYIRSAGRENQILRDQLSRAGDRIIQLESITRDREREIQELENIVRERESIIDRLAKGLSRDQNTVGDIGDLTTAGRAIVERLIENSAKKDNQK
jgi:uncharacterized coiled-coil protein SlyX